MSRVGGLEVGGLCRVTVTERTLSQNLRKSHFDPCMCRRHALRNTHQFLVENPLTMIMYYPIGLDQWGLRILRVRQNVERLLASSVIFTGITRSYWPIGLQQHDYLRVNHHMWHRQRSTPTTVFLEATSSLFTILSLNLCLF